MLENTEATIKNGQSRETSKIEYTWHKAKQKNNTLVLDNPTTIHKQTRYRLLLPICDIAIKLRNWSYSLIVWGVCFVLLGIVFFSVLCFVFLFFCFVCLFVCFFVCCFLVCFCLFVLFFFCRLWQQQKIKRGKKELFLFKKMISLNIIDTETLITLKKTLSFQ